MRKLTVSHRGVTLIEMLVVTGIIGLLAVVVLVSHSTFNKTVILAHSAADIALSLRDAETFGIGSSVSGTNRNLPYGIEFTNTSSFILFGDSDPTVTAKYGAGAKPDKQPGDGRYSASDILKQTYTLNQGITISDFCGTTTGHVSYCYGAGDAIRLDIIFYRPNTSAAISVCTNGGCNGLGNWQTGLDQACITVTSPEGAHRYVHVSQIGEIGLTQSCP